MIMQYVIIIGVLIVAAAFWYAFKSRGNRGIPLPVLIFFRHGAQLITGRVQYGVCYLPVHGGFGVVEGAPVYVRHGRPWIRPKDDLHFESIQSRRVILAVRDQDPTPLQLNAGRAKGHQSVTLDKNSEHRLKDVAQAYNKAEGSAEAGKGDLLDRYLALAMMIAVSFCGLSWLGYFLIAFSRTA
jgi:hypothetical protein